MRLKKTVQQFLESPIFRRYMFSYILIIIIPLLMIPATLYSISRAVLSEQICEAQMMLVQQARRALDYEARRYNTIAVMLSNEQYLQDLMLIEQRQMGPEDALELMRARMMVSNCQASTREGTAHMQVYLRNNGYIIDGSHALPFTQICADLSEERRSDSIGLVSGDYRGEWIRSKVGVSSGVYYAVTFSANGTGGVATLLVEMNSLYLEGILAPLSSGIGEWATVYRNGESIYQSGATPADLDWSRFDQREGQFTENGYLISYVRSDVTDDIFANAISREMLFQPLRQLRSLTGLLLAACLAACGVLSYVFAVRNFNPLRQLVVLTKNDHAGSDEYAVIREELVSAASEKQRLTTRTIMDERLKRDHDAYRRLLDEEDWTKLPLGGGGYYAMAQIALIDYTESCAPAEAMARIRDAFDFEPHEHWRAGAYQCGSELVMLIRIANMDSPVMTEVTECLRSAVQCVRDNFVADCLVGLSGAYPARGSAPDTLRELKYEAHTALHSCTTGQTICVYQPNGMLDLAVRRMMSDIVRGEDPEQALDAFVHEARGLLLKQPAPEESVEYALKRKVIAVVQEQYADPSLSVSQIAAQLGRSADYVSKVFKQTTLIGMLDYIHHVRVKAAKQILLEHPSMTIAEVGTRVGYMSADSFIRSYKRIYGITPGKDREKSIKTEKDDGKT